MARADPLVTALALATLVVCAAQTPLDVFTTAMNDMANTLEANAAALLAGVLPGATMTGSPVTNGVQVGLCVTPTGFRRADIQARGRALSPNSHHIFCVHVLLVHSLGATKLACGWLRPSAGFVYPASTTWCACQKCNNLNTHPPRNPSPHPPPPHPLSFCWASGQ